VTRWFNNRQLGTNLSEGGGGGGRKLKHPANTRDLRGGAIKDIKFGGNFFRRKKGGFAERKKKKGSGKPRTQGTKLGLQNKRDSQGEEEGSQGVEKKRRDKPNKERGLAHVGYNECKESAER